MTDERTILRPERPVIDADEFLPMSLPMSSRR
jgi:hypothetical protein